MAWAPSSTGARRNESPEASWRAAGLGQVEVVIAKVRCLDVAGNADQRMYDRRAPQANGWGSPGRLQEARLEVLHEEVDRDDREEREAQPHGREVERGPPHPQSDRPDDR